MKILALSDRTVPFIYSPVVEERFPDVELIVGCGDLEAAYLEYVLTRLNVPLLYVHGNHDADNFNVPGGMSVDGRVVRLHGLRIGGLGGSRRYKSDGIHQYTEAEMSWRVTQMLMRLAPARLTKGYGLDLLLTHSPPLGIHDMPDYAHTGFASLRTLIRLARPRLMLHGHSHAVKNIDKTESMLYDTPILNVYPHRVVELGNDGPAVY
jgi:Icc-related predicted phosphoesterase